MLGGQTVATATLESLGDAQRTIKPNISMWYDEEMIQENSTHFNVV